MMVKVSKKNKESESPAVKKAGKNLILKKKEGKVCFFRGSRFNIEKPKFAKHERGVVYIKHIPHGFFEEQILNYFKQFGRVTAYNLPRAKTGRIKGYAFIEFEHPEVAKIAAETMNNYLMFDRLLKAEYIPPENQKPQKFGLAIRDKARKTTLQDVANKAKCIDKTTKNRFLTKEEESKLLKRHKQKIDNLHQKLSQFGIDYEFQVANEPVTLTKVTAIPEDKEQIIIEVDESDDEISFKTPPNAIKQPVKKSKERILLLGNKENEKNKKKEGKEKVKKSKKFTKTIGEGLNPVIAEEEKSPSTSKKSLDNFSGKPSKKIKTKVSDKNMKNETKVEHSVKSDKNGGILKKFKKSDTTKNKKKKSKILGVMKKSKQKSTIVEPKKLKKKLKGLNLAGVKHMMNTFM